MEWIILDDGTDKIGDLVEQSGIKQIKYISLPSKLTLGAKRNLSHTHCKGSIIVYVDDDDYFPPDRVSHSVERLMNANNGELIAGASEIYLYFDDLGLYQFGPYGPNHATAGTFAFKRELLEHTAYDETACLAEEETFLKKYTFNMIQLDPTKTILVFPHKHNSFDKRTILTNPEQSGSYKVSTDKTVDDFIVGVNASVIKKFFVTDVHELLQNYKPGEPAMKPDVLQQTAEINKTRKMLKEHLDRQWQIWEQQHPAIMIKQPGQPDVALTNDQVIQILHEQQQALVKLTQRNSELETMVAKLQTTIVNMSR